MFLGIQIIHIDNIMHYLIFQTSLILVFASSFQISASSSISIMESLKSQSEPKFSGNDKLAINKIKSKSHLVVLSHGLMGFPMDLTFIGDLLHDNGSGCSVLISKSNEFTKSLRGLLSFSL